MRRRVASSSTVSACTELMKQKQYAPMTVAEMGVVLFAANEGFLRDVEINKVPRSKPRCCRT